jgi:hypothetical protein
MVLGPIFLLLIESYDSKPKRFSGARQPWSAVGIGQEAHFSNRTGLAS